MLRSQRAMLDRLGRPGADASDDQLAAALTAHTRRAKAWAATAPQAAFLNLPYDGVLTDPADAARRVAGFLGREADLAAMAAAVEPSMRRQVARPSAP